MSGQDSGDTAALPEIQPPQQEEVLSKMRCCQEPNDQCSIMKQTTTKLQQEQYERGDDDDDDDDETRPFTSTGNTHVVTDNNANKGPVLTRNHDDHHQQDKTQPKHGYNEKYHSYPPACCDGNQQQQVGSSSSCATRSCCGKREQDENPSSTDAMKGQEMVDCRQRKQHDQNNGDEPCIPNSGNTRTCCSRGDHKMAPKTSDDGEGKNPRPLECCADKAKNKDCQQQQQQQQHMRQSSSSCAARSCSSKIDTTKMNKKHDENPSFYDARLTEDFHQHKLDRNNEERKLTSCNSIVNMRKKKNDENPPSSCHARIQNKGRQPQQPLQQQQRQQQQQQHFDEHHVAGASSGSTCCSIRRVTVKKDSGVDNAPFAYHDEEKEHSHKPTPVASSTTTTTTMIRCIGVVHEEASVDNTDNSSTVLTVFDADGMAKRYQCSVAIHDLCFRDHHGIAYGELLTPCLDQESGRHKPAESASMDCFCGEDAPHWHAHLKAMCGNEDCLAMATLYEIPEITHHSDRDEDIMDAIKTYRDPICHRIDISHALPNCCDPDFVDGLITHKHDLYDTSEEELLIEFHQVVRVFPNVVKHGDNHVDDLILDESTGELFLRNYKCQQWSLSEASFSSDWTVLCRHGRLEPVASRNMPFGQFSVYTVPSKPLELHEERRHEQQQQPRSVIVRSTIYCGGICCAAELPAVREALEGFLGVSAFYVNVPLKQVSIDHDPDRISAQALLLRLSGVGGTTILKDGGVTECLETTIVQSKFTMTGEVLNLHHRDLLEYLCPLVESFAFDQDYKIVTATHGPMTITAPQIARQIGATVLHDGTKDLFKEQIDPLSEQGSWQRFPRPTVIASGLLWIVSMLSFIGGPWSHLHWVALVSILFGIPPIAVRSFRAMQRWRFDTNCLMFFASIGAIGLQDFTEAAAVVFLFALSEWLELRATSRARTALLSIIQLRPDIAVVVVQDDLVTVPAGIVPVGTLVYVRAGDKIPCDGTVEVGTSTVDESSLTGEARPVSKMPGSTVSGGTLNCGISPMTLRTTATADNSAVSRLIRLVEEAQGNRSSTEKGVDRFAAVYTPIVVLGAMCMCTFPWFVGVGREWTRNGLVLLVVACPCALIISTPVAYVAGLAAAAANGILIKGGVHLEAMAAVKYICFDKTGTLTDGKFALLELEILVDSLTRKQILEFLVTMEEKASHPVAQAIVIAAKNEGVVKNEELLLTDHKILNGEGIEGNVDGRMVHIGNDRLIHRLGWNVPFKKASSGYMSIEGYGVVCRFTATDSVRPESAEVIASLKRQGVESVMLTGDNETAASFVADIVGLPSNNVKSRLLPEDKYRLVKEMVEDPANRSCCKRGRLMMIGDGVNDAPALAIADVGVAMGEGAALSMETADITLLDSDLRKIEYGIRMGRRVSRKIAHNVVFSIAVKAVVLVFALFGKAELWAAIAVDVGAMLVVTLNAMMLLPRRIDWKHNSRSPHGTAGMRDTVALLPL